MKENKKKEETSEIIKFIQNLAFPILISNGERQT